MYIGEEKQINITRGITAHCQAKLCSYSTINPGHRLMSLVNSSARRAERRDPGELSLCQLLPRPSPAALPRAFIGKLSWVGRILARDTLSTISSNCLGSRSALQITVKSCIIWKERREMKIDRDEHWLLLALWCSYGALHCNEMGKVQWQNNTDILLRQYPASLFLLGPCLFSAQAWFPA